MVLYIFFKRGTSKKFLRDSMHMSKPVSTPLAPHFKLSELQMPQSMDEVEHMSKVSYANVVGSIAHVKALLNL